MSAMSAFTTGTAVRATVAGPVARRAQVVVNGERLLVQSQRALGARPCAPCGLFLHVSDSICRYIPESTVGRVASRGRRRPGSGKGWYT